MGNIVLTDLQIMNGGLLLYQKPYVLFQFVKLCADIGLEGIVSIAYQRALSRL